METVRRQEIISYGCVYSNNCQHEDLQLRCANKWWVKIADQYRYIIDHYYCQEARDEIVCKRYEIVAVIIRMTIGLDRYIFGGLWSLWSGTSARMLFTDIMLISYHSLNEFSDKRTPESIWLFLSQFVTFHL